MNKKVSPNWILLSLAISAFAIGSTEFISVGIMPLLKLLAFLFPKVA